LGAIDYDGPNAMSKGKRHTCRLELSGAVDGKDMKITCPGRAAFPVHTAERSEEVARQEMKNAKPGAMEIRQPGYSPPDACSLPRGWDPVATK